MNGYYTRYVAVLLRFLPFAVAFLRDRRRFLLFGGPRHTPEEVHRRRALEIRDSMLDLGPAFIKVGQVLSTRPDIVSPTYAAAFATLQDEVPEGVGGDPMTVVEDELGNEIETSTLEPVAGGSLAYVYTAEYEGERIALKVRRPGIPAIIERDLAVIGGLLPLVSPFVDENKRYSLNNAADDFEEIILDELDFDRERQHMTDIRENFRDDDRLVIPAVYDDLSSERLLAMEYLTGRKITADDAFAETALDAHEMATRIVKIYLEMGLVDGVFHADPHPGNLAVTDEGRLLIYDFGMSERIPPSLQEDIVGLYRALVRRDVDDLVTALIGLDVLDSTVDRTEVGNVLELVIQTLEGRSDITWRLIILELTSQLREFPFRVPPDVMLLLRVGTVSEGVCLQLDPDFDFLAAIRDFLVERGLIEDELHVLVTDAQRDLQASVPALARLPSRADRVLDRLERGELAVKTEPASGRRVDGRAIGYAVLTGALIITAAILTFHDRPYELFALGAAVVFAVLYLRRG